VARQDCPDGDLEEAGDGADFRRPAESRWRRPRGPRRPWRRAWSASAGLGPGASAPLAWRGFRPVVIVASREESADVRSFEFAAEDGSPLPPALPRQHIVVRVKPSPNAPAVTRSYLLCGPPGSPNIGLASRTSAASQAAFSTKASGLAVARRSALLAARSRSRPVRRFCQGSRQNRPNEQSADKSGDRAVMICRAGPDARK
jgi:hypothetical protein